MTRGHGWSALLACLFVCGRCKEERRCLIPFSHRNSQKYTQGKLNFIVCNNLTWQTFTSKNRLEPSDDYSWHYYCSWTNFWPLRMIVDQWDKEPLVVGCWADGSNNILMPSFFRSLLENSTACNGSGADLVILSVEWHAMQSCTLDLMCTFMLDHQ